MSTVIAAIGCFLIAGLNAYGVMLEGSALSDRIYWGMQGLVALSIGIAALAAARNP